MPLGRQIPGVSTLQYTVLDFCAGGGGDTHRLGFLHHAAAQFVPKFTHVPRWFQFHSSAEAPEGSGSGALTACSSRPSGVNNTEFTKGSGVLGTLG